MCGTDVAAHLPTHLHTGNVDVTLKRESHVREGLHGSPFSSNINDSPAFFFSLSRSSSSSSSSLSSSFSSSSLVVLPALAFTIYRLPMLDSLCQQPLIKTPLTHPLPTVSPFFHPHLLPPSTKPILKLGD